MTDEEKKAASKAKHRKAIEAQLADVEAKLCAAIHCDTAAEANAIANELRHEVHVVNVIKPIAAEAEFLRDLLLINEKGTRR